jgi:hypothetical protein
MFGLRPPFVHCVATSLIPHHSPDGRLADARLRGGLTDDGPLGYHVKILSVPESLSYTPRQRECRGVDVGLWAHPRVASALPHSEGIAYKPPCGEIAMSFVVEALVALKADRGGLRRLPS